MTIIKKFEPEKEEKGISWKTKKIVSTAGFFLIILAVVEIWVANIMANYGEKFENIENTKKTLEEENQLLENKLASASSLLNVASTSAALGLTSPKSVKYIR